MLESMGLILPAESLLITISIYCTSHYSSLNINYIALSAIVGAIMGDNFGYLIGRIVGYPVLKKYGPKFKLTPDRLLLGQYLFKHHGGKAVFFGRFVAILRFFTALLAGATHMHWKDFLIYNALGGMCWAGAFTYTAYFLGQEFLRLKGTIGLVIGIIFVVVAVLVFIFLRNNEHRLVKRAEQELKVDNNKKS